MLTIWEHIMMAKQPMVGRHKKVTQYVCRLCLESNAPIQDALISLYAQNPSNGAKYLKRTHSILPPSSSTAFLAKRKISGVARASIDYVIKMSKKDRLEYAAAAALCVFWQDVAPQITSLTIRV